VTKQPAIAQFADGLLRDKTAFVTGASSGLGAHFAKTIAKAGARVIVAARRVDRLEALAHDIQAAGGQAHPVALDVTNPDSVKEAFDAAESAYGPASILINNAGIPSSSRFTDMPEDEWRGVLDVNLDGVFRVGQEAARRMKAAGGGGSIVNVASVLGLMVLNRLSAYAVSKAAVVQLTKAMALELSRDGIRVNAMAPGYIHTEMNDDFLNSDAGQKLLSKVPLTRAGEAHELDGAMLLLASDLGTYMTGSVIAVDGGSLLSLR